MTYAHVSGHQLLVFRLKWYAVCTDRIWSFWWWSFFRKNSFYRLTIPVLVIGGIFWFKSFESLSFYLIRWHKTKHAISWLKRSSSKRQNRTSSVTRKPSKNKLVAGEVMAPMAAMLLQQKQTSTDQDPAPTSMYKGPQGQKGSGSRLQPPNSNPAVSAGQGRSPARSPSPTQSEYESCDPWDDY